MTYKQSKTLYEEALKYIPGGVNSPVRAFGSVGRSPIFVEKGKGSKLTDVDGNTYIDYVCSWGPLILGHDADVSKAGIMEAIGMGTTFGMPTSVETALAKIIVESIKPIEMIRMVSSGTEATMSALRLARGYTKRDKIIKFEGCYHGHSDGLLVKSGSGTLTGGIPTSAGVPESVVNDTLVAEFNSLPSVEELITRHPDEIAAIIVEPIPGNMGLIEAKEGFLEGLRKLTSLHGIVLIFDEVISGFRIGFGGASEYYDIDPDLVCLGKIIGGGMPVGAYGGKKAIMSHIAPLGDVYQAGTLSGNPIAMRMGLNVVTFLKQHPEAYDRLSALATELVQGFRKNIDELSMTGLCMLFKSFRSLKYVIIL